MMYCSVVQIEEGRALLEWEDGRTQSVCLSALPAGVCEGDVLSLQVGVFCPEPAETARRKARVHSLFEKLAHKSEGP